MFHKHRWKIIRETYAPPTQRNVDAVILDDETVQMLMLGVTTVLLQCEDKKCSKLKNNFMLGKPHN